MQLHDCCPKCKRSCACSQTSEPYGILQHLDDLKKRRPSHVVCDIPSDVLLILFAHSDVEVDQ